MGKKKLLKKAIKRAEKINDERKSFHIIRKLKKVGKNLSKKEYLYQLNSILDSPLVSITSAFEHYGRGNIYYNMMSFVGLYEIPKLPYVRSGDIYIINSDMMGYPCVRQMTFSICRRMSEIENRPILFVDFNITSMIMVIHGVSNIYECGRNNISSEKIKTICLSTDNITGNKSSREIVEMVLDRINEINDDNLPVVFFTSELIDTLLEEDKNGSHEGPLIKELLYNYGINHDCMMVCYWEKSESINEDYYFYITNLFFPENDEDDSLDDEEDEILEDMDDLDDDDEYDDDSYDSKMCVPIAFDKESLANNSDDGDVTSYNNMVKVFYQYLNDEYEFTGNDFDCEFTKDFYKKYEIFCKENNMEPIHSKRLSEYIKKYAEKEYGEHQTIFHKGIKDIDIPVGDSFQKKQHMSFIGLKPKKLNEWQKYLEDFVWNNYIFTGSSDDIEFYMDIYAEYMNSAIGNNIPIIPKSRAMSIISAMENPHALEIKRVKMKNPDSGKYTRRYAFIGMKKK